MPAIKPYVRILVLEDDQNLQEIICELIEDLKHTEVQFSATGVSSAAEAVVTALKHLDSERSRNGQEVTKFDLIISDIRMAGEIDGLGALEQIKLRLPDLRCIVITGYTEDGPQRALHIGVNDYLRKPFTLKELEASIMRVWDRRSLLEKAKQLITGKPDSPEAQRIQLYTARTACFQFIWVGFQSKVLSADRPQDLLVLWDQLCERENTLFRHRGQSPGLTAAYHNYLSWAKSELNALKPWQNLKVRCNFPKQVEISRLAHKITERKITFEQFHEAARLSLAYLNPKVFLPADPELRKKDAILFTKIWGTDPPLQ